jgi:hypothetical protein
MLGWILDGVSMTVKMSSWPISLASAIVVLLGACNSNQGGPAVTAGAGGGRTASGSGGQVSQTTAQGGNPGGTGGQTSAAATGGNPGGTGGKSGQGGQTSPTATGGTSTTDTGGTSRGTGGRSGQGGTSEAQTDAAAGAGGGGGQGGGTSQPKPDASDAALGGAGGSGVADGGKDVAGDAAVGHPRRVILVDEGNTRIHLADLQSTGSIWTKQFTSFRDIQLVGDDRLAVSTLEGYVELDLKTGATKKEFTGLTGIETLRRLPNGNTVFGGNSDGGITLQELDSKDAPVPGHKMTFIGSSYGPLRLLRRTPQGTFLIGFGSEDKQLAEVNWDKQVVWQMDLPNAKHTYQGLRLPDNTIAVAAGYAAAIYILDPVAKKVLTTIGGPNQPNASTIHPNFYAGFQVLPNGHFVVTNWQNHGGGHGGEGIQLLEYDSSGSLVWQWKQDPNLVSSLHGVLVLDGLDTTKLHDDVNGVLGPVTQ